MTIALIDNGSLAPAAHRTLRAAADDIGLRADASVAAISWKHSGRIPASELGGSPAWTLAPWIRAQRAQGESEFLFVPFFISPQGAIGSALRGDLESLAAETGGFEFRFAPSLTEVAGAAPADSGTPISALTAIVAERIRESLAEGALRRPAVIVVDHGGPAPVSASVRDRVAAEVRAELGSEIGPLAAASMESPDGPDYAFNQPLLADQLRAPGFDSGDTLVAPLFLLPGRHAGPGGDLAQIARSAEARAPGLRCHLTSLVGTHPFAIEALARGLETALAAPSPRILS